MLAQLQAVSKSFGKTVALDAVDFSISPGETVAFVGPNGAGKSTAINVLLGLRRPDQGQAFLFGGAPHMASARRRIGATPQDAGFPAGLKVIELIGFARAHYPNALTAQALVDAFHLSAMTGKRAVALSGGQQRLLAVALAFIGQPDLVFLDEPTTGMDSRARSALWAHLRRYRDGGGSVLLTTHYLEEAEALADRVVLINKGRIVRAGTVADIKKRVPSRIIRFHAARAPELAHAQWHGTHKDLHTFVARDADDSVRELVRTGVNFSGLEVQPASLEMAISSLLEDTSCA